MNHQDSLSISDTLFYSGQGFDAYQAQKLTDDSLIGMEDGELYLQYSKQESISLEDGRIKSASYNVHNGFGLRGVIEDRVGYAHAGEISLDAIKRAAQTVKTIHYGKAFDQSISPPLMHQKLYPSDDPLAAQDFAQKVKILEAIDIYARNKDVRVEQVSASIAAEWDVVQIIRPGGFRVADIRPLIRVNITVVLQQDGRREAGSAGVGGRGDVQSFLTKASWQEQVDEAIRQAEVNLMAVPAPAGEMTVVLGAGWPGILLHEAVGHGLEGDFNRKESSVFSNMMGKRVAAKGVNVIDDGTIKDRRGSLTIDDEGTPGHCTHLIEDGILVNYLQDRQNARLMGMKATGNGRRQSYAHQPMPRMTNTFMQAGDKSPEEIITSVTKGVYAVNFGGGQVDIINGKFVFSCTEAYKIEAGKVKEPIKGATLIGSGADALTRISMIGNDLMLDPGIGTCGKNGQGVPVGVGQPTLRLDGLTVGGTVA